MRIHDLFETEKKFSDAELIKIAKEVGEKMYGKSHTGLVFSNRVKTITYTEYFEDSGKSVDTYDYVFFPSTQKGRDAADTNLKKSDIDVDGNIYLGGADGVKIITEPFVKNEIKRSANPEAYEKFKEAVLKWYPKAKFSTKEKYGKLTAMLEDKYVGVYYLKKQPSRPTTDDWQVFDIRTPGYHEGIYTWKVT